MKIHRSIIIIREISSGKSTLARRLASIKPEDIRNGKLHIKQQKSDHWVVIPLRPMAHEILITKFRGQIPRTTNPEFNENIKKVYCIAEIDESIKFSYKKGNRDIKEVKPKYK